MFSKLYNSLILVIIYLYNALTLVICVMQMADKRDDKEEQQGRGKTRMSYMTQQKPKGIKKDLEWNDLGQPIGDVYTNMISYLGSRVRATISINSGDWRKVPQDLKDGLWEDIIVRNYHYDIYLFIYV